MGEQIHNLRLGNNYTTTFFAADAGDPIDGNIYGSAHCLASGRPAFANYAKVYILPILRPATSRSTPRQVKEALCRQVTQRRTAPTRALAMVFTCVTPMPCTLFSGDRHLDGLCADWLHREALLLPTNVTWRALGGSIDLYVFDGPTQEAVTKQYQLGAYHLHGLEKIGADCTQMERCHRSSGNAAVFYFR